MLSCLITMNLFLNWRGFLRTLAVSFCSKPTVIQCKHVSTIVKRSDKKERLDNYGAFLLNIERRAQFCTKEKCQKKGY